MQRLIIDGDEGSAAKYHCLLSNCRGQDGKFRSLKPETDAESCH